MAPLKNCQACQKHTEILRLNELSAIRGFEYLSHHNSSFYNIERAVLEALEGKDYQHKKIKMKTHWKNTPPAAPFYAVIFISRKSEDLEGYAAMDVRMMQQAQEQPGYLGYSSVSDGEKGVFISYWQSKAAIENWRHNAEHKEAKANARRWYSYFHSLVCEVKNHQEFESQLDLLG